MIIKEFRIPLPLTVDEYQVAQLYSVAELSKHETGGGEGVEVLKNEPFTNQPLLDGKYTSGQYTHKIYHLASKVPGYIRVLAPKGSLEMHEEAWNAFPYCRTVLSNPGYMKDGFVMLIESLHFNDRGEQENVHLLDEDKLKQREVVFIDIANDPVDPNDFAPSEDPTKFKSVKSGRGPLTGDWMKTCKPVMTCYKLVTVSFKFFGLQNRVENFVQKSDRRLFVTFHRKLFCWMDSWYRLTMKDIRNLEEVTSDELKRKRKSGSVQGMVATSD